MSVFEVENGLAPSHTLRVKINGLSLSCVKEIVVCNGIISEKITTNRINALPIFI